MPGWAWGLLIISGAVMYLVAARNMKWPPFNDEADVKESEQADLKSISGQLQRLGIPVPRLNFNTTTPAGVSIMSPVEVPMQAQSTIDMALAELFEWYRAAFPGWSKAFTHNPYAILFVDPMGQIDEGSPRGAPTITVRSGGQEAETAGTCIGFPYPMVFIVLPHHEATGWNLEHMRYLFDSVFNEGEHFIQSHNSRAEFDKHTGFNDVHRHVPPPVDSRIVGLYARALQTPQVRGACGVMPPIKGYADRGQV